MAALYCWNLTVEKQIGILLHLVGETSQGWVTPGRNVDGEEAKSANKPRNAGGEGRPD